MILTLMLYLGINIEQQFNFQCTMKHCYEDTRNGKKDECVEKKGCMIDECVEQLINKQEDRYARALEGNSEH